MDTILTNKKFSEIYKEKIQVSLEKIEDVLKKYIHYMEYGKINISELSKKIFDKCSDSMTLNDLYYLIADECVSMSINDPDYNMFASKISTERLHMVTHDTYLNIVNMLYHNYDKDNKHIPLIHDGLFQFAIENIGKIQQRI